MGLEQDLYNELCAYTLVHGDSSFIHQHVVDAGTAQRADEHGKPIAITFALIGLYLHVERHYSGRQVQRAHMQIARRKQTWPSFAFPRNRGSMTVTDVMAAPPGPERDSAIHRWCASVWEAFADSRPAIAELLRQHGIV
jgi:hypothetical protein